METANISNSSEDGSGYPTSIIEQRNQNCSPMKILTEDSMRTETRDKSYLNIVITQQHDQQQQQGVPAVSTKSGHLNVFIPQRQMSLDDAIIQGKIDLINSMHYVDIPSQIEPQI